MSCDKCHSVKCQLQIRTGNEKPAEQVTINGDTFVH